ncbi:hypothetical protein [Plebeiibacterium marinum]|uniref:Uncharacterized protein n=1 Tax=Plebeiibacterium marinum TaxID=2992111 RepID=A0AAE3MB82_9BACT|nr:hypothetical protein [Plebeiobacterium marinum]MCW3804495.1 hypothetical protein [Plebeiobacterium marinum]
MKFCKVDMKYWVLVFVALLLGSSSVLNAQEAVRDSILLSLHDAWERANTYSKELRLNKIDLKVSEENVLDAKRKKIASC